MTDHIPRYADKLLGILLPLLPAIMIDGAKGVGKTSTAEIFASDVLELDKKSTRTALEASDFSELDFLSRPLLIDEWQKSPEVWERVRRMVDNGLPEGSILLTGSMQSTDLSLHSGSGRIVSMRMRPLSLAERFQFPEVITLQDCFAGTVPERIHISSPVTYSQYMHEIIKSGFPRIYRAPEGAGTRFLNTYIQNIATKEFAAQGIRLRQPGALIRWMRAYAAATGTTTSYTKMLDAATPGEDDKPSRPTTTSYREALQSLWLIDDLECWGDGEDFFGRLKQTPKHFLADPGLEARLLNLSHDDLIRGRMDTAHDPDYGSIAGRLFESLCAMSVRSYASALEAESYYMRTANGSKEIDLIIVWEGNLVAIEVKTGAVVTDDDVKHLNSFAEKVGDRVKEKVILTTGDKAYRRKDRVLVIPAALFA